eukprot:m.313795 g.313795  ORF g.313795 m.313795 type:complete len:58 (+) comp20259_c4_seq1:88-261(+)
MQNTTAQMHVNATPLGKYIVCRLGEVPRKKKMHTTAMGCVQNTIKHTCCNLEYYTCS